MIKLTKNKKWIIGTLITLLGIYVNFYNGKEKKTKEKLPVINEKVKNNTPTNDNETKSIKQHKGYSLTGTIRDSENNIICCTTILFGGKTYKSDSLGQFHITLNNKPNYSDKIIITKEGFIAFEKIIYFNANQSLNIILK